MLLKQSITTAVTRKWVTTTIEGSRISAINENFRPENTAILIHFCNPSQLISIDESGFQESITTDDQVP